MKYYSKTTKGFYCQEIHGENMPEDATEISDEEHNTLLEGQSSGLEISFEEPKPVLIEHLVTEQEQLALDLRAAHRYLEDTDFYFTIDKYNQLPEDRKLELERLREEKRTFIRLHES